MDFLFDNWVFILSFNSSIQFASSARPQLSRMSVMLFFRQHFCYLIVYIDLGLDSVTTITLQPIFDIIFGIDFTVQDVSPSSCFSYKYNFLNIFHRLYIIYQILFSRDFLSIKDWTIQYSFFHFCLFVYSL